MILRSQPSLGLDPITAITAGAKLLDFLGDQFGGPTQAQIQAAQQAAAAAQRRQLYVAGALVGGALLLAVLLTR